MAVTVALGPEATGRTRVRPAPLVEAVLALHVLVEPGHHPQQHPFVRRMRELPPAFRAALARVEDTFRHPPEPLLNPHADPGADVDTLLGALAVEADRLGVPEVATLVADFWRLAFAQEWERIRPRLLAAGEAMEARIADEGVLGLLDGVAPWVAALPARHELQFGCTAGEDAVPAETTRFDMRGRPVTVVPSLFTAPHVHVDVETPAALQLVVPVHDLVTDAAPPAGLSGALLACGSDARLRILHVLAGRPRTVQELAPLLSMAPSTVSRHLKVLAEHGLVTAERDGWYVLYELRRRRVDALLGELGGFLDASRG